MGGVVAMSGTGQRRGWHYTPSPFLRGCRQVLPLLLGVVLTTGCAGGGGRVSKTPNREGEPPSIGATSSSGAAGAVLPAPVTLPAIPASVSAGSDAGDLAVALEDNSCAIVEHSAVSRTIPSCGAVTWVPGTEWVVFATVSQPTAQAATVTAYQALDLAHGTSQRLPCTGSMAPYLEGLPGPAVAFDCGGTLEIAALGPGVAKPKRYGWATIHPNAALSQVFAVDPAQRYVALVQANEQVSLYAMPNGGSVPGTFVAGAPLGMAWSNDGQILAIASPQGVAAWRPRGSLVMAKQAAQDNVLTWLPDDSAVLAVSSFQPASPLAGYRIAPDGTVHQVAPPEAHVQRLAWGVGGGFYWYIRTGPTSAPVAPFTLIAAAPASA